ncbi:MAG: IclR family transcriptional regulator C-terminal domain-containing protein, partial [Comamonas sp.]
MLFGQYLQAERALSFAGRADGHQRLTYRVDMHRPLSLVWGASGRAILAFLPDALAEQIIAAEGPSPAHGGAPDAQHIWREILQIRAQGWAMSENEKLPDARGIAAPVFGPHGVVDSICLTMPMLRSTQASLERLGQ